jgi:hypothetical protein
MLDTDLTLFPPGEHGLAHSSVLGVFAAHEAEQNATTATSYDVERRSRFETAPQESVSITASCRCQLI